MADSAIAHNGFSMRSNIFPPNLTTISQVMPVMCGNMFIATAQIIELIITAEDYVPRGLSNRLCDSTAASTDTSSRDEATRADRSSILRATTDRSVALVHRLPLLFSSVYLFSSSKNHSHHYVALVHPKTTKTVQNFFSLN